MGEKIKKVVSGLGQRWKSMSKKLKVLLGIVVLALVVAVAVVMVVVSNRPYTTLFADLNQTDMSAILSYLSENGVTDYKVEGDTILVREEQEAALKAQVLQAGYPSSGYSYDTYFGHVGTLTTESERNQLVLYELQDRMAAVIRNFDGVKEAVVLLTPGEDHTYVLDSSNKVDASAAVTVTMEDGKTLTNDQAKAIRNLVSRGLAGLNVDNVVISDIYGNSYGGDDDFTSLQDASDLKVRLEEQWNNNIRTRVMQVLLPLYGEGNVSVSVNTVVDVDRTYTDSTDYTLEDWAQGNGDGIIGSQIWSNEIIRDGEDATGGVVGTEPNADTNGDLNTYVENQAQPNGTETGISTSGQTDHLVDTQKQQVERVAGYIADVMVSVTINQNVAGNTTAASLYPHVARAAGISTEDEQDKISILIAPFNEEGEDNPPDDAFTTDDIPDWVLYAAIGGGVLFLLLLLLMFILHRRRVKKRRKREAEAATVVIQQRIEEPEVKQADIMDLETEKSMELRQDVRKFAEDNPEIAAQMVKNWLREGERAK